MEYIIIGIPGWTWKGKLLSHALKHPHIEKIPLGGVCHECVRHKETLEMFDKEEGMNYRETSYFKYQRKNGRRAKDIKKRMIRFRKLYHFIRSGGRVPYPVVTDDGCRLDGSHRCAILVHLNRNKRIKVNVVKFEYVYSEKESIKLRREVAKYRAETYGLRN